MNPIGMSYAYWHFPEPHLDDLSLEIELAGNTKTSPGRYFQLYQGKMRGVGFYLGFQTDVWHPSGQWRGPGLIFSRWDSTNADDARLGENGWIENPPNKEGGFVGVRLPYNWNPGSYTCRLAPSDTDASGVWYEFNIQELNGDTEIYAGGLRFPNAGIDSGGITWTEAYPGRNRIDVAANPQQIPETVLCVNSVVANNGTLPPIRCDTYYKKEFNLSDVSFRDGTVILRSGNNVKREHPPQSYRMDT